MSFYFVNIADSGTVNSSGIPIVFLPGWGFDERMVGLYSLFEGRQLIVPRGFVRPVDVCRDLLSFLDEYSLGKVEIAGWSMGANIALDFACRNEERVASIELFSMRRKWPQGDVDDIRQGLREDLPGFMAGFYRKCFLGSKKEYRMFVEHLQDVYLREIDVETLYSGLDYLEQFVLPEVLEGVEAHCIHGARDVIAPVMERPQFAGVEETLFANGGHAVLFEYGR